jgi:DNA-binding GntR family transcriptional regulator
MRLPAYTGTMFESDTYEAETLAGRSYRKLRDAIASGELSSGQKVTERGLATQLGVSPTPVREAIRRLEQDGLLERTGPRTVKVTTLREAAISDLAEVEVGLRGMVARFAARHATTQQLDELDAILDEADDLLIVTKQRHAEGQDVTRHLHRLLDAMQRFNEKIDACAANPVLVRLLDQSRVFSQAERRARLVELALHDEAFGLERYAKHRELVRALRDQDSATAEALVVEDVRGGLSDLLSHSALEGSPAPATATR